MRISDWSSDVCSSDLFFTRVKASRMYSRIRSQMFRHGEPGWYSGRAQTETLRSLFTRVKAMDTIFEDGSFSRKPGCSDALSMRSEEHTSELQSLMRISYAVFCLQKKNTHHIEHIPLHHT